MPEVNLPVQPAETISTTGFASQYDLGDTTRLPGERTSRVRIVRVKEPDSEGEEPKVPVEAPDKPRVSKKPEAKAAEPSSAASDRPKWIEDRAREIGVPDDVIAALDADSLSRIVSNSLMKLHRDASLESRSTAVRDAVEVRSRQAETQPGATAQTDVVIDWGADVEEGEDGKAVSRKWSDSDIAPPVVRVLKDQARQIKELRDQLAQIRNAEVAKDTGQQLDLAFSKWPKLFGSGPRSEVMNTPFFATRKAIVAVIGTFPKDVLQSLPTEKLVEMAVRQVYGEGQASQSSQDTKTGSKSRDAGRPTAEDFQEGVVGRPTQRRNPDVAKGKERARNAVREYIDSVEDVNENDDTTLDEFLN